MNDYVPLIYNPCWVYERLRPPHTIHVGYMNDYVPLIYNPCWVYERLRPPHTIHVGYMNDYVPLIYNPCWVYERLRPPHTIHKFTRRSSRRHPMKCWQFQISSKELPLDGEWKLVVDHLLIPLSSVMYTKK